MISLNFGIDRIIDIVVINEIVLRVANSSLKYAKKNTQKKEVMYDLVNSIGQLSSGYCAVEYTRL